MSAEEQPEDPTVQKSPVAGDEAASHKGDEQPAASPSAPAEPESAKQPPSGATVVRTPKIDFAALRRSKLAKVDQSNASVSRLFGVDPPAKSEPTPQEAQARAAMADAIADLPDDEQPAASADWFGRWLDRADGWLTSLRSASHGGMTAAGWIGVLFAVNGALILLLALIGWI